MSGDGQYPVISPKEVLRFFDHKLPGHKCKLCGHDYFEIGATDETSAPLVAQISLREQTTPIPVDARMIVMSCGNCFNVLFFALEGILAWLKENSADK